MAALDDIEETYREAEILVLEGTGEHKEDVANILGAIATKCSEARMLIMVLEMSSRPPREDSR